MRLPCAALVLVAIAGCSSAEGAAPAISSVPPSVSAASTSAEATTTEPTTMVASSAATLAPTTTPSPTTTQDLAHRARPTVDLLPPPPGEQFTATVGAVPDDVLARSTWRADCPVAAADLRYVTLSFFGFDGRFHTGELLVHADAADAMVEVFRRLHEARYPIEEMRITRADELDAPPTGDGNDTSAFVCRNAVGSDHWSQHAYGRAIDVNPFQNPYDKWATDGIVLPELAGPYLDRADVRPGMILPGDLVTQAFAAVGWKWGGDYRSFKDWQHFSANGK